MRSSYSPHADWRHTSGSFHLPTLRRKSLTTKPSLFQDGWSKEVFPGGSEGVIKFTISAQDNGVGPLRLDYTGFTDVQINSGEVSIVQTAITGGSNWTITWTTSPLQQNHYQDFCFGVANSVGVSSEQRCLYLQTRGRNCRSFGDPHMTTFDETAYDFMVRKLPIETRRELINSERDWFFFLNIAQQGLGDFYLVKSRNFASDRFSIQVRYVPCSADPAAPACNAAIAFTDDRGKVREKSEPDQYPSLRRKTEEVTRCLVISGCHFVPHTFF